LSRQEVRDALQAMFATQLGEGSTVHNSNNEVPDFTESETRQEKGPSHQEKVRDAVLARLEELGSITIGEDDLIYEGSRIVLPKHMEGDIPGTVRFFRDYEEQQNTSFNFSRTFNYRPWDGANAFQNAMKKVFGTTGVGRSTMTMFGPTPPEFRTVALSHDETIQVPWGTVELEPLNAEFFLMGMHSREYGTVFAVSVTAPRKRRAHIEAFFQVIEDELRTNSIYKGKAFTGGTEPVFLDTESTDRDKVVYSKDVLVQLETNMWSLLRYTDKMRANGIPLKRAVLVEGPYGTGKTLAGALTAKEAVENGWTFLLCRTGKDDLNEALQTAQLYAPSVVWYEDIDIVAKGQTDEQISKLLDSLDGITNKGVEVLAGFTTNHVESIQKGVLRPGRLDAVINIGELDREGFEKLIKVTISNKLLGDIDYDKVAEAFTGFLPAFTVEAARRAVRYSISRSHGVADVIGTDDLVYAARGLRTQLELMQNAQEGVRKPALESTFTDLIRAEISRSAILDEDGDTAWTLGVNPNLEPGE